MSVYQISNTEDARVYIGSTKNSVSGRWLQHINHHATRQCKLYRAMRELGADKFRCETLHRDVPVERLREMEAAVVRQKDSIRCGMNHNVPGRSTSQWRRDNPEKMREARMRWKANREARAAALAVVGNPEAGRPVQPV